MRINVITKVKQQVSELAMFDDPNVALFAAENPTYIARVKSLPQNNDANNEITELIAKKFNVPKTTIRLTSGPKSRHKVYEF